MISCEQKPSSVRSKDVTSVHVPVILFVGPRDRLNYETFGAVGYMVENKRLRREFEHDLWSCFVDGPETPPGVVETARMQWLKADVTYSTGAVRQVRRQDATEGRDICVHIPLILFFEDGRLCYEHHGSFHRSVSTKTKRRRFEKVAWSECVSLAPDRRPDRKIARPKLVWLSLAATYAP